MGRSCVHQLLRLLHLSMALAWLLHVPPSHTTLASPFVLPALPIPAGYVKEMATNEWGHVVLCTALSVVDDTSLLNKVIVSELKVREPCCDPHFVIF